MPHRVPARENYEEGGRFLIEPYYELPTKSELPIYYEIISNPMDIVRIRKVRRRLFYGHPSFPPPSPSTPWRPAGMSLRRHSPLAHCRSASPGDTIFFSSNE